MKELKYVPTTTIGPTRRFPKNYISFSLTGPIPAILPLTTRRKHRLRLE